MKIFEHPEPLPDSPALENKYDRDRIFEDSHASSHTASIGARFEWKISVVFGLAPQWMSLP